MSKSEVLQTRIEPELRENVEKILGTIGMTTGQVINLLFHQIILTNSVPIKLEIPKYTKYEMDCLVNEALENKAKGSIPMDGNKFFDELEAKYGG